MGACVTCLAPEPIAESNKVEPNTIRVTGDDRGGGGVGGGGVGGGGGGGRARRIEEGRRAPPGTGRRGGDISEVAVDVREPDPQEVEVLQVEKVDFEVVKNTRSHHTDEYDITEGPEPQLVIRRGQNFQIKINFSRPYDSKKDDLRLVFQIGENPKPSKETHVEFVLSDKDEEGKWGGKLMQQADKAVDIKIFLPVDCIVGKWTFKVDVVKKKDNKTSIFRYNHKDPIYILFNPWCKEDTVYLDNPTELDEYIMNDKGKIYAGSAKRISAKPWIFGQFSGQVLDCCMYLLDMSGLNMAVRNNPIPVVRKLSALVNSSDEGGVLTGNWSGNYSGGKSPLSWTGSAAILEQYYETKYSVRFGQCWVFSGVLTTVCRALGIPARSVTNFASAHDCDASITIDIHYGSDGEPLEGMNEDSIWNFHVWNEVWLARPDLPAGYGGWQACDSTPQEASDDVYCCGPCPVRAIKEGEVNLPYDGPFIFAEVNADKVYWMIMEDGSTKNVYIEKRAVGKFISTMSLRGEREDVTKHYKYPEDSPEERVAVRRANQVGSSRKDVYVVDSPKDVKFDLKFDSDKSFVGDAFTLTLQCHNQSSETRSVDGLICVNIMYYTGVVADLVTKSPFRNVQLKAGEKRDVEVEVSAEEYHKKLKDCCMFSVSVMAKVDETKQIFTVKTDLRLRKPHLTIKGPSKGQVGKEFEIEVSFTNPMPTTLTDCYLEVEGPGLTKPKQYPQGDVHGKGSFLTTIKLKPTKKGERQICILFNSQQLEDVNGTHNMQIEA